MTYAGQIMLLPALLTAVSAVTPAVRDGGRMPTGVPA